MAYIVGLLRLVLYGEQQSLSFLLAVVLKFYDKDDNATGEGNQVGGKQENTFTTEHPALAHEGKAANGHHDKTW